MATRKGYLCALYIRTGGTFGSPTFTEVALIEGLTIADPNDKLSADARDGSGIHQYEPGMIDLSLSGRIRVDWSNTAFAAIASAKAARTALDVMVLDGKQTVDDSRGYRMEMKVFTLSDDQALDAVLYRELELAPCPSDEVRQTVVVSGGAPVFTTITAA